jgi:nicotinate-nucleotide pyrophosphorylase
MLDNMKIRDIRSAVKIRNNTEFKSHHAPSKLEASGGVRIENIKGYAATGVDIISEENSPIP